MHIHQTTSVNKKFAVLSRRATNWKKALTGQFFDFPPKIEIDKSVSDGELNVASRTLLASSTLSHG